MCEVLVWQIDQLVLAQYQLFGFAFGMLDDIERFAQYRFALALNQPGPPVELEIDAVVYRALADGNQRVVQRRAGQKKLVWLKPVSDDR